VLLDSLGVSPAGRGEIGQAGGEQGGRYALMIHGSILSVMMG
jgi:hypothetical protein